MPLLKRRNSTTIAGLVAEVLGFADKVEKDSSTTYFTVHCTKGSIYNYWTLSRKPLLPSGAIICLFLYYRWLQLDCRKKIFGISLIWKWSPRTNKCGCTISSETCQIYRFISVTKRREESYVQWLDHRSASAPSHFHRDCSDLQFLRYSHCTVINNVHYTNLCVSATEVMANIDLYESQSSMKRHTPGHVLFEGYVTKLGGNKDDPYNLSKGTWNRRYMVLQDDLRYYIDESTWRKGGNPKGVVSLDNFFVTAEKSKSLFTGLFTIHALPWPLICRADDPSQVI